MGYKVLANGNNSIAVWTQGRGKNCELHWYDIVMWSERVTRYLRTQIYVTDSSKNALFKDASINQN